MAYILFTPSASMLPLDARFHAAPMRGRKTFTEHLYGVTGGVIVLKHCGLQLLKHLGDEQSAPVPTDDARELALFTGRLIATPLAKDLLTNTTARLYEWILIERVFEGQPRKAGSFIRGAWEQKEEE